MLSTFFRVSVIEKLAEMDHSHASSCFWLWSIFTVFGACGISAQAADSIDAKTLLDVYVVSREADPNLAVARYRVDGAEANGQRIKFVTKEMR
jgi:hypothetical protein